MILTITIDTHPHTNALIEGQVKRALEDFLADRHLGVVTGVQVAFDKDYVLERLNAAYEAAESGSKAEEIILDIKDYLK